MKKFKFLMIGLVSLVASNLIASEVKHDVSEIFKTRCANCHGITANGVPKIKDSGGVKAENAATFGITSEKEANIYGPPLNYLTKDEILNKLRDFRNQEFDAKSFHSVMRENLKKIEKREGKMDDEKMAEYISTTFNK